jgi:Concanavalin A-like lectin/glucanases superfamily/PEP-CTERM motif
LNFYPIVSGAVNLTAGALARVTLTRDAAGVVTGYVNGVQEITFNDTGNQATFSDPQQLGRLFHDDNATGGNESSSGFVDYVRIYNVALSASEVGALTNPVPEPGTWALMAAGLLAVGAAARRKR